MNKHSPSRNYKEVQSIPGVGEVRPFAINAHRDHFDCHLQREEGENDVVEHL